jgi:hypothetical protein
LRIPSDGHAGFDGFPRIADRQQIDHMEIANQTARPITELQTRQQRRVRDIIIWHSSRPDLLPLRIASSSRT